MQFNSLEFLWFCGATFIIYWMAYRWIRLQNLILLIASFYFYSRLHFTFPLYLGGLILLGYVFGRIIDQSHHHRKTWLVSGLILISSCLVILKYSNFGIETINKFGANFQLLKWIVPVGLSFYTFSSVGYITDVYRRRVAAEKDFISFASYVSFFPHLLAGPIPTATLILPQFLRQREFLISNIEPAIRLIVFGLFKKMVIADNISIPVNYVFAHADTLGSISLYLGVVLFSFQIYADFSGYSEIAQGVSKLFGFELVSNFKLPFLSRHPGEFWRRWHTSLTRWLTDYLYKPLGGRAISKTKYIALVMFIFFFSGLWHGSNWTFVLWGILNGLYYVGFYLVGQLQRYEEAPNRGKWLPDIRTFFMIFITFNLVTLSRVLFKSDTLQQAKEYFVGIFTRHDWVAPPEFLYQHLHWCVLLVVLEWIGRFKSHPLDLHSNSYVRFTLYLAIGVLVYFFHKEMSLQEYYYFRF